MGPLSEAHLTLGCYGTAFLLNLVIALYAYSVARRAGVEGVFGRTAALIGGVGVAFMAFNGWSALEPTSAVPLLIETLAAGLLLAASYSLYTLVRVE
jgi:hypothetical protein